MTPTRLCPTLPPPGPPCAWEHKPPVRLKLGLDGLEGGSPAFMIPFSIPAFRTRYEHLRAGEQRARPPVPKPWWGSQHDASPRPSPRCPPRCPHPAAMSRSRHAHLAPLRPAAASPGQRQRRSAALETESSGGEAALPGKHVWLPSGPAPASPPRELRRRAGEQRRPPGMGKAARDPRQGSGGLTAPPWNNLVWKRPLTSSSPTIKHCYVHY